MKSDLFNLAKLAAVFTVIDGFIPRAETLARSKVNREHQHHSKQATFSRYEVPQYHTNLKRSPTEIQMGLLDLNPFHGSGSGGTKGALDEQWEIQQEILRARRGDKSHHAKKRTVQSPNLKIKSAKKDVKVNRAHVDDTAHHHKTAPKFFWDLGN